MAVLGHELKAERVRPVPTRHFFKASSGVEGRVPGDIAIGREMESTEAQRTGRRRCAIDQCGAEAAALPAIKHRQLIEPCRPAGELHQGESNGLIEARDGDPQAALSPSGLERGETRGRHGDNATESDARVAPVSLVFDLRQQLDFVVVGTANHDGGLVTLSASPEEVP